MPWIPFNADGAVFDESRGDVGFLLDNDVDLTVILPFLQGNLGLSVVPLPVALRARDDEDVLAEAKRQGRILVTHDRDFLDTRRFPPAGNPGVVIVPGGEGNAFAYRGLIGTVLVHVSELRHLYAETVLDLASEGRVTLWNYDRETDAVEPISMRVRWDAEYPVEIWFDDNGDWGFAPPEAWDEPIVPRD